MRNQDPDATELRLDDLFRTAVHHRPEIIFGLIAPDLVREVREAATFTRLDTQLAPSRFLPDIAYQISNIDEPATIVLEAQSQAKRWKRHRASAITRAICNDAPVSQEEDDIRLVEIRTQQRSSMVGRTPSDCIGRLRFEPTNALLDLTLENPDFQKPSAWCFLAFSQQLDAEVLDRLMTELGAIAQPDHALSHTINSMDVYLLGAISRVRFPEYVWSQPTTESYVNNTQNIRTSEFGHLTPEEVQEVQVQAARERRRVLAEMLAEAEERGRAAAMDAANDELARRMAEAEERRRGLSEMMVEAEERGRAAAERALLLEVLATVAPTHSERLADIASLDELKRQVMALVSSKG